MMVDVHSGVAPPEWQSYVGPVLVYRPQRDHFLGSRTSVFQSEVQHFNKLDCEIVWDFMLGVMEHFGDDEIPVADRDFTFEQLRDFTDIYLSLHNLVLKEHNIERYK